MSKDKWFLETSFPGVRRCKKDSFRVAKEIYKGKSKFQKIYIFESPGFGKILTLDGIVQLSQSDEFIYHEVIAHIPLLSHPNPKRLLIVGGGDGGVLREAVKHLIKEIRQVEIDRKIVEVAKKYLSFINKGSFSDSRFKIFFEDDKDFIRRHKDFFDIIVGDSTDPVGPGKVLFSGSFYRDVFAALKKDGMAIFQLGPFLDFDLIVRPAARKLRPFAKFIYPLRLPMPSCSCGSEYCFMLASKKIDPAKIPLGLLKKRLKERLGSKARRLRYYTPELHLASMVMPRLRQP